MTAEAHARVSVGAQLDLRLDARDAGPLPFVLPLGPNTVTDTPERSVLWLGPDEWLVLAPRRADALAREIGDALSGVHHSVVDVSANRVVIEVSGPSRFALLSLGCALDLHHRSWGPGRCAQTLLARVPVILWERGDTTAILVRPSFAGYVDEWLTDQAANLT